MSWGARQRWRVEVQREAGRIAPACPTRSQHHKEHDETNCINALGNIECDAHTHVSLHLDYSGEDPWPRVKNPLTSYYAPLLARPPPCRESGGGFGFEVGAAALIAERAMGGQPSSNTSHHLKQLRLLQWTVRRPAASISG